MPKLTRQLIRKAAKDGINTKVLELQARLDGEFLPQSPEAEALGKPKRMEDRLDAQDQAITELVGLLIMAGTLEFRDGQLRPKGWTPEKPLGEAQHTDGATELPATPSVWVPGAKV